MGLSIDTDQWHNDVKGVGQQAERNRVARPLNKENKLVLTSDEKNRASQPDIPHPRPSWKETFETAGSKNDSWRFY